MAKKTLVLNPTRAYPDGFSYNLPKDVPKGEVIIQIGWDGRLFLQYEEADLFVNDKPHCNVCGSGFHNTQWHEKYYDHLFGS